METGTEEVKILQSVTLLLTTNTVVHGETLAKVIIIKYYIIVKGLDGITKKYSVVIGNIVISLIKMKLNFFETVIYEIFLLIQTYSHSAI